MQLGPDPVAFDNLNGLRLAEYLTNPTPFAKLTTSYRGEEMHTHKHYQCSCGHMVHANSDDEMVRKVQEHMTKQHGKTISREEVLKAAHEHQH
jgi:predicted small metal-binding protein